MEVVPGTERGQEGGAAVPSGETSNVPNASSEFPPHLDDASAKLQRALAGFTKAKASGHTLVAGRWELVGYDTVLFLIWSLCPILPSCTLRSSFACGSWIPLTALVILCPLVVTHSCGRFPGN